MKSEGVGGGLKEKKRTTKKKGAKPQERAEMENLRPKASIRERERHYSKQTHGMEGRGRTGKSQKGGGYDPLELSHNSSTRYVTATRVRGLTIGKPQGKKSRLLNRSCKWGGAPASGGNGIARLFTSRRPKV